MRFPLGDPVDMEAIRKDAKAGRVIAKLAWSFIHDHGLHLTADQVLQLVGGDDAIERVIAVTYALPTVEQGETPSLKEAQS